MKNYAELACQIELLNIEFQFLLILNLLAKSEFQRKMLFNNSNINPSIM